MNVQCGSSAATVFVFSDLLTFLDIFGFDHSSEKKTLFGAKSVFCVQTRYCEIFWRRVLFSFGFVLSCVLFILFYFFPASTIKA